MQINRYMKSRDLRIHPVYSLLLSSFDTDNNEGRYLSAVKKISYPATCQTAPEGGFLWADYSFFRLN